MAAKPGCNRQNHLHGVARQGQPSLLSPTGPVHALPSHRRISVLGHSHLPSHPQPQRLPQWPQQACRERKPRAVEDVVEVGDKDGVLPLRLPPQ